MSALGGPAVPADGVAPATGVTPAADGVSPVPGAGVPTSDTGGGVFDELVAPRRLTATARPTADSTAAEPIVRRAARAVLARAARGRRGTAGTWGAAVLGEFEETAGRWEAVRWAASGVWLSWWERSGGRRPLAPVAAMLWPAGRLRRLLVVAVWSAVLLTLVNQFVLTLRYVPSISMEPTLMAQDRTLVDRLVGRITGVDRGDVVLLERRFDGGRETFGVRVLGLPGDTVSCVDGALWRNGTPVDEPYLRNGSRTECAPVTVPPGAVYVLGDHREAAADSRVWGPVAEADVVGDVLFRVWPPRRVGPLD